VKIFLTHRPGGAYAYISDGWLNALRDRGHEVRRWDGNPLTWKAFRPDLYVGCSGHRQPLPPDRGDCKVAIHVNPYGPVHIRNINESQEAIAWVLSCRPDAVFGYGKEADRLLWSYWTERHGVPWMPMPTAGDATLYRDLASDRTLDLAYVGGYWPYKGQSLGKFLLPVLRDHRLTVRVHGWGEWPDEPWYSRDIDDRGVVALYNAARVAPCVSEPHTQQYGFDVPERVFKAALCGALPVHDPVPDLKSLIPGLPVAQNPQNYLDLCHHYARHDEERLQVLERVRREVLGQHTYHHRMASLLAVLGFPDAGMLP